MPRTRHPCRIYSNKQDAFYRFTDGSFMRAVPCFKGTMMRRCDERGQIIPRLRMSKKRRLGIRRALAAVQTAAA